MKEARLVPGPGRSWKFLVLFSLLLRAGGVLAGRIRLSRENCDFMYFPGSMKPHALELGTM